MTTLSRRLLIAWLVLTGLTLGYLWIDRTADHGGSPAPSAVVTSTAILIALVKVRIIFREFMEVRGAPPVLRHLTDAWLVIIAVSLLGTYVIGTATA